MRAVMRITLTLLLLARLVLLPQASNAGPMEIAVYVDGTRLQFDVPPLVIDGRTLVPVRRIFEALGATVAWDQATRTVTAVKNGQQIALQVDAPGAQVNGFGVDLDVPPRLVDGRVLVPLRFVSESLGASVEWDGGANSVRITSPEAIADSIDRFADGTRLEDRLAGYEKYYDDGEQRYYASLRDGAGLYRSDRKGGQKQRIIDATTEVIGVAGGYVYYLNGTDGFRLYRVKVDGTGNTRLLDAAIESAELREGRLYFYSVDEGLGYFSANLDGSDVRVEKAEIEVKTGDWIVSGTEVVEGKSIYLKGDLIVRHGASLTLRDTRLVVDTGKPGAELAPKSLTAEQKAVIRWENCRVSATNDLGGIETSFSGATVVQGCRLSGINTGIVLRFTSDENAQITANTIYTRKGFNAVDIGMANGTLVSRNTVIKQDRGQFLPNIAIQVGKSEQTRVIDNVLVRQEEVILLSSGANNGTISGNMILGNYGFAGLSVRHDAGNNILENNFLQGYYDGGYRQPTEGPQWGIGIYLDTTQSTNIFRHNVVNNYWLGIGVYYASNSVFDANRVYSPMRSNSGLIMEPLSSIALYRSYNNYLINNELTGVDGSGIMLLAAPENVVAGNQVRGFATGLGLWYGANSNTLQGNLLSGNTVGMVVEQSGGNRISGNGVEKSQAGAWNNGDNRWSGNYWGTAPEAAVQFRGSGEDPGPLASSPAWAPYPAPGVMRAYRFVSNGHPYTRIRDHVVWRDATVPWQYYNLIVEEGGTLELDNATLLAPAYSTDEPELLVHSGGTLIIKNSRVLSGEKDMYIAIRAERGSRVEVRNSRLENLLGFDIAGDEALVENSTFTGGLICLSVLGSARVVNNQFSRCLYGLNLSPHGRNYVLEGNVITDTVTGFRLP